MFYRIIHVFTNKSIIESQQKSAWIFSLNHGIDDQQSVTILVNDMINAINNYSSSENLPLPPAPAIQFPLSVEEAVAPGGPNINTLLWAIFQVFNSIAGAKMIPVRIANLIKEDNAIFARKYNADARKCICELFSLTPIESTRFRQVCKRNNVTVTHALAAVMICMTAAAVHSSSDDVIDIRLSNNNEQFPSEENYRFLLSVGMRPFGAENAARGKNKDPFADWTGGTVACAGGAVDYIVPVSSGARKACSILGESEIENAETEPIACSPDLEAFWKVAQVSRDNANDVIERGFVTESVRLFGLGMQYVDILQAVELDATSQQTLGRGYSCGVSNVGQINLQKGLDSDFEVQELYYGTSHARNGCLAQLSCLSVGDVFCGCLQFPSPLLERDASIDFRTKFTNILKNLSKL